MPQFRTTGLALAMAFIAGFVLSSVPARANDWGQGVAERKREAAREYRSGGKRHHGYSRNHDRRGAFHRGHRQSLNPGAYIGNLSAYRDPDNGIYFYLERDGNSEGRAFTRQGPKLLQPGSGTACEDSNGVCVIRP